MLYGIDYGERVYAYSHLTRDTTIHLWLQLDSLHQKYPSFIIIYPYESLSITFIDLCA